MMSSTATMSRPRGVTRWPEATLVVVCCLCLWLTRTEAISEVAFPLVYVSVGVVYGIRMWSLRSAGLAITLVAVSTGGLMLLDVARGHESAAELVEVPLLSIFFLTLVLHVNSRRRMSRFIGRVRRQEERLYAYATHEVMTPLTVARGEIELLRRNGRPSDADLERAEDVVLAELQRSEQFASDLLLTAEVTFGGAERQPTSTDDLVLDAVERWQERMPGRLCVDALACGVVMAVRDDLSRALDKVLGNAVRFGARGGTIRIASVHERNMLVITVTDDGCGIPAGELDHVCEPFYRGSATPHDGRPGSGLGLAIVKGIVHAHGGRLRISSTDGFGTQVQIELPRFVPAHDRDG